MATSWECRVSQKQQPPMGHSPFPALTWAEGTETLAVPCGTGDLAEGSGMAPCSSTSKLEHLLLLPTSHLDPACPGEGLVLMHSCSRKRNGSPMVVRTLPRSFTDMPWQAVPDAWACHASSPCCCMHAASWLLPSLLAMPTWMHATLTHFTKCCRKSLSPFQHLPAQME